MSVIKIDGAKYEVGETELRRNAEIIYDPLTAGTMLDFSETDDAAGTKYTYSFTVEPRYGVIGKEAEYDAFYYDITAPKSVRFVELPFGSGKLAFQAKIKSAGDGLLKDVGGARRWGGLTVTFIPVKPQRYAQ